MNIFSFLLSGASFATSVLSPVQWHIPIPNCLPLVVEQHFVWQPASLHGSVLGNMMTFTPLLQGEVQLKWKLHCETETVFRIDWNFTDQSFYQGVFEQNGFHAQEMHSQQRSIYLKAPGEGFVTLYIPQVESNFSFTVQPKSLFPSFTIASQFAFPWRFFQNGQGAVPAFFELRNAVTSYFPQAINTGPVSCHTRGDLLSAPEDTSCHLARLDAVATQDKKSLYTLKDGVMGAFSPAVSSVRPQAVGDIFISEVMWAGSYLNEVSLQDQWIELYNATDTLLNLVGARLRGAKTLGDIQFYSDFYIPPKGFVLVGKQLNHQTSLVRNPERIELLKFPHGGRAIQLISSNGVVLDETPAPPWPAGKDDQVKKVRSSMQRRWFELPGIDPMSWGDCSGEEESFRCRELSKNQWKSFPGQNLGTPWQHSVL